MKFEEPTATELQVPGWQLMGEKQIPALISAHALKYKSCEPQFDRQQFPFRTTIVLVEGEWHVVEFASTEDTNDEIEELGGKAGHVVTFFSREPNDPKTLGDLFTGSDDPFLSPAVVSQPARNSFAWQGRSLEDGVYDGEEMEEPEMGEQLEVPHRDPFKPEVPVGNEIEEFELEGEVYRRDSTLRKLREGLKYYGLPKGGSKEKCWKRLVEHHQHFAERAAVDVARKEFHRKKGDEGEEARMQSIPKQPTKAERQVHELTHWPFQPWCQACVACRAKEDPHHSHGPQREEAHSSFPVLSMDFFYTRGGEAPEPENVEEIRRYDGDERGGVCLLVTDDWTKGVLALPIPGKGRAHLKYLAGEIMKYISGCGFSTVALKSDGEPAMRMLQEIIQQARLKLGFKTTSEFSGPGDSQGNGRIEREIQTVRGLAKTLMSAVKHGAGVEFSCYGPLFTWALRHAGWLLSHYRKTPTSATAYEMVSGRRYVGKLCMFGERVLARVPSQSGQEKFVPAVWLGRTDRGDLNICNTVEGIRWSRSVRRLPEPFDAETLQFVKVWSWSIGYGQIGMKAAPLQTKMAGASLPAEISLSLRNEEKVERKRLKDEKKKRRVGDQHVPELGGAEALEDGRASEAGSLMYSPDVLAADSQEVADAMMDDLIEKLDSELPRGSGTHKRSTELGEVEEESPKKATKAVSPKAARTRENLQSSSSSSSSSSSLSTDSAEAVGRIQRVRMVVNGELLRDGDATLSFPSEPPDLTPEELEEVEELAELTEVERLIEMTVLKQPEGEQLANLEKIPLLTTKMVKDWRFREMVWQRRARLVARDYAWQDPNRTDVYAPAGGMSLLRLIPAVARINGWKLWVLDVKDAYLNCPQPKLVRVRISYKIAEKLDIPQDWLLGRVLPGQREGAAEWYKTLAKELERGGLRRCPEAPTVWFNDKKSVILLSHVDDILLSGVERDVCSLVTSIQENFKVSIECEEKVNFLKRTLEFHGAHGANLHIQPNEKYIDSLVKIVGSVRKSKVPGEVQVDGREVEDEKVSKFRSAVGTLLYISCDRPDCQFLIKELAGQLQRPTVGGWRTLEKLVGYLVATKDFHTVMSSGKRNQSFTTKVKLTGLPEFVEPEEVWLLEVATDADWSGDKTTRSSTSSGVIFLGGNWMHSYSRTQKNITLSSTESEYVALVAGRSTLEVCVRKPNWHGGKIGHVV